MTTPIDRVLVVVPARDEEELVGPCLAALAAAVEAVRRADPLIETAVVVVADDCRDETAARARHAGARVVVTDAGCVGAARRLGVEHGLALLAPAAPERTWVASTDADTRVPPDWLTHQLGLAAGGTPLVIGRVVPDPAELDPVTWRAWSERHTAVAVDAHVHGANLGFRLDAYLAAGGWPRLAQHEDRHLVDALLAGGAPAELGRPVVTSGRLQGRVPDGFAGYLRDLRQGPDPAAR